MLASNSSGQFSYCRRRNEAVSCALKKGQFPFRLGRDETRGFGLGEETPWHISNVVLRCNAPVSRLNSILEYRSKHNVDGLDPLDALSHPCKPFVRQETNV